MTTTFFGYAKGLMAGLLLCGATTVHAQWGPGNGSVWGDNRATTAAQANAYGMSSIIQSTGQANLLNSQANINNQQAVSANLDNHLKYTNTYFEMRSQNRQAKAAEATPQLSTDQLYRLAEQNATRRPSNGQLDPITGQIVWPMVLRDDRYAAQTKVLNELFAHRAEHHGYISMDTFRQITSTTRVLLDNLIANVAEYPPNQYIAAKRMVEGLAFEAGQPIQSTASTN